MLFQQSIIGNSRTGLDQWNDVREARTLANLQNRAHFALSQQALQSDGRAGQAFRANEGIIPEDVYQDFDNVTIERFRSDDGDTFLNDLLPLSRPISVGKLIHKFRRASDAGLAQTSMTGQIGVKFDQVEYSYDGTLVPVHDTGFSRNWREWAAMTSEGFDALIDDQRESVATLRRKLADSFMDGHVDSSGNAIVVDSTSWLGMRNDSRVAQVDLGAGGINFDFTDTAQTYSAVEAAFKQVRDVLWITNTCEMEAVYYISREIMSNIERESSENANLGKFVQRLSGLMGVADIKVSSKLTGNQMMAFPLDANKVRPVVGMGLNTVATPRPLYNDPYAFIVWGAIGFQIINDYNGNTCALYASA